MRPPHTVIAIVILQLVASACSSATTPRAQARATRGPRNDQTAVTGRIHWIEDDYATALTRANAEKKPIVIDGWAMWCAPCIAMREEVLGDPSIQAEADRFVWLALDDDNEANRPVQIRHHIASLPTFVVVDPSHDAEVARWVGVTDPRTFRRFLDGGERWFRIETSHDLDPLTRLRSSAEKNDVFGEAKTTPSLFSKVIEAAPATWPRRDEVSEQLVRAATRLGDTRCGLDALRALGSPSTGLPAARVDLIDSALTCAALKGVSASERSEIDRLAARELRSMIDTPSGLSIEDRDLAFVRLRQLAIEAHDSDAADRLAHARLTALDDAASAAFEKRRGSRFDLLRANAMSDIGQTELALMMLKNSQSETTDDPDTTVRLAMFLMQIGRHEAALDEATNGLSHTRGVRIAKLHEIRGRALMALHRPREARDALEAALVRIEALPWAMRADHELDELRATMARLSSLP